MPDTPAPLSPEEVDALDCDGFTLMSPQELIARLRATVRDRERQRDLLTEDYHTTRATIRSFLTEEQNVKYPTTLDKIQFLGAERDELQRQLDEMRKASLDAKRRLKAVPESLLCDQRDPCSYDHTCRIHKALAELRRIAGGENG